MKPLFLLLSLVVVASGCTFISSTHTVSAEVEKVVDGDTAILDFDKRSEEIRFRGIDTPEVNTENDPYKFEGVESSEAGRECLKNYGEKASSFVKERISNSTVEVEYRTGLLGGEKRGAYDRLIGTIFYDEKNKSLNKELVEKGLARSYSEEGPYFEDEVEAKLDMKGVWKCQRVG